MALPDERAARCAAFLEQALAAFRRRGVRVRRVLTDNAKAYTVVAGGPGEIVAQLREPGGGEPPTSGEVLNSFGIRRCPLRRFAELECGWFVLQGEGVHSLVEAAFV